LGLIDDLRGGVQNTGERGEAGNSVNGVRAVDQSISRSGEQKTGIIEKHVELQIEGYPSQADVVLIDCKKR
jgi:hypothetical protein